MSFFLTRDELAELTGYKTVANQIDWLDRQGWSYEVNAQGRPVVLREHAKRKVSNNEPPARDSSGLLEAKAIAEQAAEIETSPGVYFLISNEEIVYVGMTSNLAKRLSNHCLNPEMSFNKYYYLVTTQEEAKSLETQYISKFQPKLNSNGVRHNLPEDIENEIQKRLKGEHFNDGSSHEP